MLICLIYPLPAAAYENKVVLAYVEYPPYYGESLENGGPITEIIVQAFNKVGYAVKLKFVPWARGLEGAKQGTYDGLFTAWYTKDREKWFVFSAPLYQNKIGFYKRKGEYIKFNSFEDLKSYKIGVVRGYIRPLGFKEANLQTIESATDRENLLLLTMGRIDLVLTDKTLGKYIIGTQLVGQAHKLEWIAPPIEVLNQYLMISKQAKDFQKILQAFNLGLKKLTETGEMNKILLQHGF
ncbi:MAG: transporter substrate-binding domain-containing protein [Oceanospirillaceae bacterium]|nr:transporter substrate-binding domain-containing protein [Oceanospirillaceae bacterium]